MPSPSDAATGVVGAPRVRAPLLHGADAARALDAAERILRASLPLLQPRAGSGPESIGSYGGAAVVADALARAGRGDPARVKTLLQQAFVIAPDRHSLYNGAAGLLVVLDVVDPMSTAPPAGRARLRTAVAGAIHAAGPVDLADVRSYDLVSGVAGQAIALRDTVPGVLPALRAYAERFADAVDAQLARPDPHVAINLGLAHGVPGLLAALNFALPAERALARRYVDLLLALSHGVGGARRWDAVWRPEEAPSARRAWCYQTVGVAAALYDRAVLDGDGALRALAADAVATVLDARYDDEYPWDAALCHGRSGAAAVAWHFDDPRLTAHAAALAAYVLAEYDERRSLGYDSYNLHERTAGPRADFLDGALGIAQFLVDAATAQERRWLPLFGLSPD